MPKNRELIDFQIQAMPAATPARVENNWGTAEVLISLLGGAGQMYDNYNGRGDGYQWLYMSRECLQNLHRATGEFLAREAAQGA